MRENGELFNQYILALNSRNVKLFANECQLKIKSEPFLANFKFKSEYLRAIIQTMKEDLDYGTTTQEVH